MAIGLRGEGITRLVGAYPDEVEASLQFAAAPRDPMAECMRGEITLRALSVLIQFLPEDSPAAIAVRGNSWTVDTWILWDISAQDRILNATLANMFRDKGQPAHEPKFLPTPEQNESVEDVAAAQAEANLRKRERAEMDQHIDRIFANPN